MDDDNLNIDKYWDFSDTESTRDKFRSLQEQYEPSSSAYLEIITQIVRTHGLEGNFTEGHDILDSNFDNIEAIDSIVQTRYYLERGRLYNSNNKKSKALQEFHHAWDIARESDHHKLAVDAAHMIAIAKDKPKEQIKWNMKAIEYAESAEDDSAKSWLGTLYNNTGWSYHDLQQYDKALDLFEKALAFHEERDNTRAIRIAKWTIGRVYRSLDRIDEALSIMHSLEDEFDSLDIESDGYTEEELGELYLLQTDTEKSRQYFTKAYKKLRQNQFLVKNQQDRLNRIKKLSDL